MKKIILIITVILVFSCKENEVDSSYVNKTENKIYPITERQDTIIENISKICEESKNNNIVEYNLCKEWKILDEKIIRKIIKSGELGDGSEGDSRALHYTTSEFPFWITADMTIGNSKYKLKINGGSYFYITNQKNKSSLYFCNNNKYRNYFITGIGSEDDELYTDKIIKIGNEIKSLNTDLSTWIGDYDFDNGIYEQGYKNYHIKIEKDKCIFYQGQLPACMVECLAYKEGNELLFYLKSNEFKKSQYDISLIESLQENDYLLKISKNKNKYFINSKLIKYWDEKKNKFNENVDIEAIKK